MEKIILSESEKEELESLRKEKRTRELTGYACEHLKKHGVPSNFSKFVIGETEDETLANIKAFSSKFSDAKSEILNLKVYNSETDAAIIPSKKRGIKYI